MWGELLPGCVGRAPGWLCGTNSYLSGSVGRAPGWLCGTNSYLSGSVGRAPGYVGRAPTCLAVWDELLPGCVGRAPAWVCGASSCLGVWGELLPAGLHVLGKTVAVASILLPLSIQVICILYIPPSIIIFTQQYIAFLPKHNFIGIFSVWNTLDHTCMHEPDEFPCEIM